MKKQNTNNEQEEAAERFPPTPCSPSCLPHGLKPPVYDTGLKEKELEVLRAFTKLQHPEMDGPLLYPSKESVPQDQAHFFEFCQAPQGDEFHEFHRQLYIRAKQYMDFLDNPTTSMWQSLEKGVQDLLAREGNPALDGVSLENDQEHLPR